MTKVAQPIVVLGMGRSGTTIVAKLIRSMGVELGKVTPLMEPQQLVDFNEWLLRRAGGSWEYPLPTLDMLASAELREQAAGHVREFAERNFGDRLAGRGGAHWGWKDPRTVFTLPLWGSVFPGMRLLAVRRHGFDTALSLHARARVELAGDRSPLRRSPYRFRLRNLFMRHEESAQLSVRSLRLGGALSMWAEYNRQLDAVIEAAEHPLHLVRLEDLLRDPHGELGRIAQFIGLGDAPARVEHTLSSVTLRDASRGGDHPLVASEALPADLALLRSYGYESAPPGNAMPG